MDLMFRTAPYDTACDATVTAVDERGVVLDRTVFYPTGGGQPGDIGQLKPEDGVEITIVNAIKGEDDSVIHVVAEDATPPAVGAKVTASIDWPRRHRLMRMHTCLHLLSSLVEGKVTGGQVGTDKSRLDFDIPGPVPEKDALTAALNRLIGEDHPVSARWVTDAELDAQPELVKTMSVAPPRGSGHVRLIAVEGVDLQACGGTHVTRTGEIGPVRITKIENKGRQNRRIVVAFDE